jgi:hypothetical protein
LLISMIKYVLSHEKPETAKSESIPEPAPRERRERY